MQSNIVRRPGIAAAGCIIQRQALAFRRLWIDQPTLILVETGYKTLHGVAGRFRVGAGEAVALSGGQAFDVANHPGDDACYQARWLAFERGLLTGAAQVLAAADRPARSVVTLGRAVPQFAESLAALGRTLGDAALPDAVVAHRALEMLVWIEAAGTRLVLADERFAPRVRRLLARDPAADWRGPQVAAELALSEAGLRRRLAAEGTSLTEILVDLRMSAALTLLQSTALQVTRIAAEVGYQSPSQFAQRFRRRFGFSPTAIRKTGPRTAALP